MSGHSKWSTIKHKKAAQDARRGKLFAKLVRAIEVAARQGGGDPTGNPTLAQAIDKARSSSLPMDNIERAIKRGVGDVEGAHYEEIWYEGYGPGGVALYVLALTDNRNRAGSDIRAAFTRNGGNLGEPGSVAYLFEQKGYLLVEGGEDEVMMTALDAGAEDIKPSGEGQFEVITAPGDLGTVRASSAGRRADSGRRRGDPTPSLHHPGGPAHGASSPAPRRRPRGSRRRPRGPRQLRHRRARSRRTRLAGPSSC